MIFFVSVTSILKDCWGNGEAIHLVVLPYRPGPEDRPTRHERCLGVVCFNNPSLGR